MTCPFNLVPQCPALSVPIGLSEARMPVGLQIIGPRFADEAVLSYGRGVEALIAAR
jgi:Asp-tRNA(Asn)/Glu-tRNA(Gln) amidotransferase A subunit family amidase